MLRWTLTMTIGLLSAPNVPCSEAAEVVAVLFGGYDFGIDGLGQNGVTELNRKLAAKSQGVGSFAGLVVPWDANLQAAEDFLLAFGDNACTVVIGYSLGGGAVTALSQRMFSSHFPTSQDDVSITIDPVIGPFGISALGPDFSGARLARNYYEQNDLIFRNLVSRQIGGAVNIDAGAVFHDSEIDHRNIHTDPRLQNRIVNDVAARCYGEVSQVSHWMSGASLGNWNNPVNWSSSEVPSSVTIASIVNTSLPTGQEITLNQNSLVNSVELAGSAGSATLILDSNANLKASIGVAVASDGQIDLQGGTLTTPELSLYRGLLSGYGNLSGNVRNDGLLTIKGGDEILEITGDYAQEPEGQLDFEINTHRSAGSLNVFGVAAFDGILNVSFADDFIPSPTDRFVLMTFATRMGTFGEVSISSPSTDSAWSISYEANELVLHSSVVFGDTNGDGIVDIDDLNAVRNHFGSGNGMDLSGIPGDAFPFDGLVNIDDLNAVRNNFGSATTLVPEPGTCELILIGWLGIAAVGRRQKGAPAN